MKVKSTAICLGTLALMSGSAVFAGRPSVGTLGVTPAPTFDPFVAAAAPAPVAAPIVVAPLTAPVVVTAIQAIPLAEPIMLSARPAPRSPYRPPPSGGLF